MKRFGSSPILRIILAACFFAAVPMVVAQPAQIHLSKHARKVQHKLAKFRSGSYLHLVLVSAPDTYGALGILSEHSFTFIDADNNTTSTYSYEEVGSVRTDKEPIGHGTEPRRHIRLKPVLLGAAAVGVGAGVYMAVR
jgi:hypothetical protein